jgi:hypothetical protein
LLFTKNFTRIEFEKYDFLQKKKLFRQKNSKLVAKRAAENVPTNQGDQMLLIKIRPTSSKICPNSSNWMVKKSQGWIFIENFKLLCTIYVRFNQCQKN